MDLDQLKKEIPYRWKIQSFSKNGNKATCVAYIDARDVMNLLDEVVGPENWKDEYYQVKDTMFCKLSIKVCDEWVTKSDGGAESDNTFIAGEAKIKGEPSDAFKRAAVKWGIGRFLYAMDIKWIDVQNKKPVDKNGNIIWDLTDYFRKQQPQKQTAKQLLWVKMKNAGLTENANFDDISEMIRNKSGLVVHSKEELTEDKAKMIIDNWT
jgi:hypothetical protein